MSDFTGDAWHSSICYQRLRDRGRCSRSSAACWRVAGDQSSAWHVCDSGTDEAHPRNRIWSYDQLNATTSTCRSNYFYYSQTTEQKQQSHLLQRKRAMFSNTHERNCAHTWKWRNSQMSIPRSFFSGCLRNDTTHNCDWDITILQTSRFWVKYAYSRRFWAALGDFNL